MSNKAMKVFGNAFLKALVVLLAVVIVVFSAVFIIKVATGGGNTNNQSGAGVVEDTTAESEVTEASTDAAVSTEDILSDTEEADESDPAAGDSDVWVEDEDETPADQGDDAAATEASESNDQAASTGAISADSKIAVLNSTKQKGLAGEWAKKIKALGYSNVYAGNYKLGTMEKSKIYSGGKDVSSITGSLKKPDVSDEKLKDGFNLTDGSVDIGSLDIVIVIGENDNILAGN
ncbi:MAG: LytR C-terminal domain-containing protein [Lachnospiraceae bacterium]|nr:LytR C-terminal domain-containing protein [Lachnospiraceae bacterium]